MKSKAIKWIKATYEDFRLKTDYNWVDGRWYVWKDKYGNEEIARMKADVVYKFYPHTKIIEEEDIVAFREIEEGDFHK